MTLQQTTPAPDRAHLNFEGVTRSRFAFLNELGFSEIEALPTIVRYRKDDVEVDVYQGRLSYEIGAGISYLGTRDVMAKIVRATDPEAPKRYGGGLTSTAECVVAGLEELSSLMQRYGNAALQGDPQFFSTLAEKHKVKVEEYWRDGLAGQLRPRADEAFHRGDYAKAAELYAQIRDRLSPAEVKKLQITEERSKR